MARNILILYLALWAGNGFAGVAPAPGQLQTGALDRLLPTEYWREILPDAKRLATALETFQKKQLPKQSHEQLKRLAQKGSFQDIALFELAKLEVEQLKDPALARTHLQAILLDYPNSALAVKAKHLLAEAEFADAEALVKKSLKQKAALKRANQEKAAQIYRRALERLGWKEWDEYGEQVEKLVRLYKDLKHPLFEGFYGEALTALSSASEARERLLDTIPLESRDKILKLAKHIPAPGSYSKGTRAIQPDQELFKNAMDKVLDTKWAEALETFLSFKEIYPDSQNMDRVNYWIAASYEALGKKEEAAKQFGEVLRESMLGYYGLEALLRTGASLESVINPKGPNFVGSIEGNLLPQQLEYLWRARALSQVGLHENARYEMDALFRYQPGGLRFGQAAGQGSLALAILFSENQFFPGAFFHLRSALAKDPRLLTRESLELYFPKLYSKDINAVAKNVNMDPLFLLSIAKQESAFNPEAHSSARALGLMQVLLRTANEIQDKLTKKKLLEPQKNLHIGGEYIARLVRQFDGNIALALAGYNAGPGRARRWWNDLRGRPIFASGFRADAFIDSIPFTETRGYVGAILRNYAWYRFLNKEYVPATVDKLALRDFSLPKLPEEVKTVAAVATDTVTETVGATEKASAKVEETSADE